MALAKLNKNVSMGFIHFLVHIFALNAFTLVFTLIKKGPRRPQTTPRIIAPIVTSVGVTSITLMVPNFKEEEVQD